MKRTRGKDSAPAKQPYVACRLVGTQTDCAAVMAGLARVFGPGAIAATGASFPARRHGPDHVLVHFRVTPGPRPRRRLALPRPRLPRRRRRPDVPATMIPVRQQIKPG